VIVLQRAKEAMIQAEVRRVRLAREATRVRMTLELKIEGEALQQSYKET